MSTPYGRGADWERKVAASLRGEGWLVVRAAGSRGECDLVALRADSEGRCEARLVQCKTGPHFSLVHRAALCSAARKAGVTAWLAFRGKTPGRHAIVWHELILSTGREGAMRETVVGTTTEGIPIIVSAGEG